MVATSSALEALLHPFFWAGWSFLGISSFLGVFILGGLHSRGSSFPGVFAHQLLEFLQCPMLPGEHRPEGLAKHFSDLTETEFTMVAKVENPLVRL